MIRLFQTLLGSYAELFGGRGSVHAVSWFDCGQDSNSVRERLSKSKGRFV